MGTATSGETFTRKELLLLYSLLQAHTENLAILHDKTDYPIPELTRTAQDTSEKLRNALITPVESFLLTGDKTRSRMG